MLGLIFFFLIFCLFLYWQSSGYKKYVVYVQVEDVAIFKKPLDPSGPHILNSGRKLNAEITVIDNNIDKGDGPGSGKLRWYVCGGIDCDEGWQNRFINPD